VETSKAWLRTHPEIDLVSRDRGQIFREAATEGAPQAKQVVDRYHVQKNFAEALEKFFRKQERLLKKATGGRTGKAHPAERVAVPERVSQERRARCDTRHKLAAKTAYLGRARDDLTRMIRNHMQPKTP
jgi:transposase